MTLIVILSYGGGQAIFDRHLPFWLAHKADKMLVVSPEDYPTKTSLPQLLSGHSEYSGPQHARRLVLTLHALRRMLGCLDTCDTIAIFEYDSLCLVPTLPTLASHGIYGYRWADFKGVTRFQTPSYVGFPFMFDTWTLFRLLPIANDFPDLDEGFHDRMMASWAYLARLPLFNYTPKSYCRATITEAYRPEMIKAIQAGATMIHGIKDQVTLDLALASLPK